MGVCVFVYEKTVLTIEKSFFTQTSNNIISTQTKITMGLQVSLSSEYVFIMKEALG